MAQEWTPDRLSEIMRGFQPACVIRAGLELDVFSALAQGGKTAQQVARGLKGTVRGTEPLLNALAGLGLVRKSKDVFTLTPFARQFLLPDSPDYLGWGAMHAAHLMDAWGQIANAVRTGKPAPRPDRNSEAGRTRHKNFIMAMHNYAGRRAGLVVEALNLRGVKTILDVGGGPGTYAFAFAAALPAADIAILDSPPTCAIARDNIAQRGLEARIRTIPGDFNTDALGTGYDLILMSSILHIYSAAENKKLIKKGLRALNPGGRLVVLEIELDDSGTKPLGGAMFSINMLVNTETGKAYAPGEIKSWLTGAGFKSVKVTKPAEGLVCLAATKAK